RPPTERTRMRPSRRPRRATSVVTAGFVLAGLMAIAGSARAVTPGVNGRIVFSSDRTGSGDIYVMDANGAGQTRLTNDPAPDLDWAPAASPTAVDGGRSGGGGGGDIYVMDADGSNQARLTTDPAADRFAGWSPDGSRIVFESDRTGGGDIYVMDSDGTLQAR